MDDSFYVSSLKTVLTETQEHNVRDLRKTLQVEKGAIYSRFCGSGKTLAILTYLLSEGLSCDKKALVVAPISAMKAWTYNGQVHFSPQVQVIQLDKNSKNQLLNVSLDRYQVVVVNFETLTGAYDHACKLRQKVLREELDHISARYPSWQNSSALADLDKRRFEEARARHQQILLYCREQQSSPTIHLPIPFPDLAEKEESRRKSRDRATDFLFRREWGWLVMDEAHEGRNRYNQLHRALLAVNAHRRIAMTATICSNGISDFISMLDLISQTPEHGWRKLCANVDRCIQYMNEVKCRCVVYSPLEEDKAIERLYKPTSILVHVPLTQDERQAYLKEADGSVKKSIFARTTKLRQMCDGPAKTHAILSYLERCVVAHREKAVIFTGFVEYTYQLGEAIRKRFPTLKLVVVTGKTNQKKRSTTMVNEVARCRGSAVYLVTMKIMSLGVDMHFVNHALLTSPWWNPTIAEQAMRRLTRPQQTKAIRWVSFVMKDTVEEGIDLMAYYKNQLNTRLLEGDVDGRMLERITSKKAIQRAKMSAGRLREILSVDQHSTPSSNDPEEDGEDQAVMQAAINGDTNSILKMFTIFNNQTDNSSSSSSSSSFMDGAGGDIMQMYHNRFDLVMESVDDMSLPPGEPIDFSSQVTTKFNTHPQDSHRQQDIERLLRKRKKTQRENERMKRERAQLSLVERQEKKQKTSGRTMMRIDFYGNIVRK